MSFWNKNGDSCLYRYTATITIIQIRNTIYTYKIMNTSILSLDNLAARLSFSALDSDLLLVILEPAFVDLPVK